MRRLLRFLYAQNSIQPEAKFVYKMASYQCANLRSHRHHSSSHSDARALRNILSAFIFLLACRCSLRRRVLCTAWVNFANLDALAKTGSVQPPPKVLSLGFAGLPGQASTNSEDSLLQGLQACLR